MRYLKAFLVAGPIMGVVAHYTTSEPMPWWPDTVIFAGFMGAMAAFVRLRLRHFDGFVPAVRAMARRRARRRHPS